MKVEDILSFRHFLLMPPKYHLDTNPEDIEGEVWKDIEGYEGRYLVSNMGRIKSVGRANNQPVIILKQFFNPRGYIGVNLYANGKMKTTMCHILVSKAFIPNPENKKEVNHCFPLKYMNFVGNLEWSTRQENVNHAMESGLVKTKLSHSIITAIRSETELTAFQISKKYNIEAPRINLILKGKLPTFYSNSENNTVIELKRIGKNKFTKDQVLEMFNLRKAGKSNSEISEIMNCTPSMISKIILGQRKSYNSYFK